MIYPMVPCSVTLSDP